MNFREELSRLKERKLQREDSSTEGIILREAILPYIEEKVSVEKLTKGIEMAVYHCDRQLLLVIGRDIVHQHDFMDAKETSQIFKSLKSKFEEAGLKIGDVTLYRYLVTIKA